MIKSVFETLEEYNWIAIVVLLFFFAFFIYIIVDTFRKKKNYIDKMSNMPFEDDLSNNKEN